MPSFHVNATEMKDGTYSINYTVLKAGEKNVSIANDYFDKPATLIVQDGKMSVQVPMNHSKWITSLAVEGHAEKIIKENKSADTRVSEFPISTVDSPVQAKIDVYINQKLNGEDFLYDNSYTIQLDFDKSSLSLISGGQKADQNHTQGTDKKGDKTNQTTSVTSEKNAQPIDNPKTSDLSSLYLFVALFVLSGAVLFIRIIKQRKETF